MTDIGIVIPELLLVEDSDDDTYFFRRTLKKSGLNCHLHHVTNGAEAVNYIKNASTNSGESFPKAIFLDLKMPIMNGFEVLAWLQSQTLSVPVHVIVLSGSEHQDDKNRAARLGAAEYLVKPVKVEDLHRCLQAVCPEHSSGART